MADLCDFVGRRVRLRVDHNGSIDKRTPDSPGGYECVKVRSGDEGVVVSSYWITMDSGVRIYCMGSDFEDPDEQFKRLFDLVEQPKE